MSPGLPPAPRWAWVAMIAGAVAIAVMLPIAIGRGQVALSESGGDRSSAAAPTQPSAAATAQATAAPTTADEPPVIAVYGDNYTSGTAQGGNGSTGWPALVADRLGADIRVHAVQGAGYVAGPAGSTFPELVQASPEPDADVVVLFGSRNDTGAPTQQISSQAAATYATVTASSPSAALVVIGPAWSDEAVPADTLVARDAVAAAAESAGATFVDPLADGWFFGRLELIGGDAINPTDEGHIYLAGLLEPVLGDAIARAADDE